MHDYQVAYSRKFQDLDDGFLRELKATEEEVDSCYRGALQRFLYGIS